MRTKLFLLIASVLMTVSAMAANFSVGGLYYSITSDNTVQVVAPTTGKYTGDITIPETVTYNATTYRVTAIGDDAFKGANQVTSVTLPLTGITSIGGWAFNDCTGLTSFTIPASVTSIGEKAFYFCDNLQHLYLHSKNPASYNPGNMAFSKIHYGSHVCTLHVPTGCTAAYAADATFSVFTQVAEFDPPQVYELYISGTQVTSLNASDILGDGVASYDASSNTLTVNGNITAPDNNTPCIDSSIHNLTINVASAATLTAYEKTIKIQGITTIIGSAKLTVNETKPIINGTEELSAIYAVVNNLNISNADLHVNGDFYCSGDLKITNSTLSVERYIAGGSDIKITNSAVSVTNGSIMGYISCTLTDCYFKTPQGGYYDTLKKRLVDANGDGVTSVEIVAEKINLMDNASNAEMLNAYNGETVYVTLKDRTLFKDGKWNTLTLPFNVATLTGTPLEGATVMEMNTAKKNGFDTESGTLYLAFKTATQIEAGKPYLVKWESGTDIVEPVFSDVTISSTTPTAVESTTSGLETVKMVGNYAPVTVKADDQSIMFMGDDNSLYYSSEDRTLRNFRAHFEIPSQKNALALAHNFVLDFDGDVVTNIDGIRTDNVRTVDGWYSLDGRRLDRKPTRKGVYIHNGNKVIVK